MAFGISSGSTSVGINAEYAGPPNACASPDTAESHKIAHQCLNPVATSAVNIPALAIWIYCETSRIFRRSVRKILLVSQYIQMASAGILTALVATGLRHVWPILCLSAVSGLAQAFGGPAYSALIPTLVEPDDMPNAIALNSIQFNMAVTIGPALAGQALAKLGAQWCFGLNAFSFLAPVISLSMISARYLPEESS